MAHLLGLVLAGGDSRRMGRDKGELRYRGVAQARYHWDLLTRHLERCFVSINPGQRNLGTYADLPVIIDSRARQGPATGLLAAHEIEPRAAWLVVAVDLVYVDDAAIGALIRGRQPSAAATAFQHADGTIEPLLAIWEPAALALLATRLAAGDASPRRCLESAQVATLPSPGASVLESVDSPAQQAAVQRAVERRR